MIVAPNEQPNAARSRPDDGCVQAELPLTCPIGPDGQGRILLAGAAPGGASGNAVSSDVLLSALDQLGPVGHLAHRTSFVPSYRERVDCGRQTIELGTQPFSIHAEAVIAGVRHRRRLRAWSCGWAVNSRYAGALFAARVPYAIWEATLTEDELRTTDFRETRHSGRGSGLGVLLHSLSLPIGRRLEGLFYQRAVVLCAMSEYTRGRILAEHQIEGEKVLVLRHPPSLSYLSALAESRARSRSSRIRSNEALQLLFVGRVDDPRKGALLLLEAVCRARACDVAIELTVVGPYSHSWHRRFAYLIEHSRARLLGQVNLEQLADEYLRCDCLVIPSRQEGFGIVVAEAFHAGLPVISTRCGGPEDTILKSGGGLLIDNGIAPMVSAFRTVANNRDLRCRLAECAHEYAGREFSFAVFAKRVRELTSCMKSEFQTQGKRH